MKRLFIDVSDKFKCLPLNIFHRSHYFRNFSLRTANPNIISNHQQLFYLQALVFVTRVYIVNARNYFKKP